MTHPPSLRRQASPPLVALLASTGWKVKGTQAGRRHPSVCPCIQQAGAALEMLYKPPIPDQGTRKRRGFPTRPFPPHLRHCRASGNDGEGAGWGFDFLPALLGRVFLLSSDTFLHLSIQVGSCFTARGQPAGLTLGSTDVDPLPQPGGEDVTGSIPVTVVLCTASGAPPPAGGQVFLPVPMPTLRAGPGGGLPAGDSLNRSSVHPGLGRQEGPQQAPTGVCNGTGCGSSPSPRRSGPRSTPSGVHG